MFHHPQVSHHPSFLLASSNHCVCTLDQYRSKDVKCFSRLSAFCKGEIMGYKGIREMTLLFDQSLNGPYSESSRVLGSAWSISLFLSHQ